MAPATALPACSKLREQVQAPPPAVVLPPSLPSALSSAQPSPAWPLAWPPPPWSPLLWPSSLWPSSPPTSQSVTRSHPDLVLEAASVCKHSSSPPPPRARCVHLGGSLVSREWQQLGSGCLSCWGQGPRRHSTLPPSAPSFLHAPPCRAGRSAGHRRLGVLVREAISEGVLWLGQPRERLAQVPPR